MRHIFNFAFVLSFLLCSSAIFAGKGDKLTASKKKYVFDIQISGSDDSLVYLANYYGTKQYYFDTAFAVGKSKFRLEKDSVPGGIYLVVLPDKAHYFEMVVSGTEYKFSMATDKMNMIAAMTVTGSKENELFYTFQKKLSDFGKRASPLQDLVGRLKKEEGKEDSLESAQEELTTINSEVTKFKEEFIRANAGTFVAKVFQTSQEPEVPESPTLPDSVDVNTWKYNYFKSHYFDGVDFTDERLLRTPTLARKIEYYIEKLVVQVPDSINAAADWMAAQAKPNREVFKYVVHWITNTYEKSKIMGLDAVFVHMADNYYCKGQAWWVDSAGIEKICDRAKTLEPLLIGKVASNIILPDTAGVWHNLHKQNADFTVLYFWSPTCGHCKKVTPELEKFYQDNKSKGVQVFGVCTELENTEMKQFIKSKKLTFINVSDTPEINKNAYDYLHLTTVNSLNFRSIYDIYSTPQVYVLDKEKRIIAKRLGVEQLEDFIDSYRKQIQEDSKL
jgi:peroxiredoxin